MEGGWRDGWSSGEKGERHVIICRSSTSPVNPRSRLTWLIKEAIKGPPPEILRERDEREKEGHRPERYEEGVMGRMRDGKEHRGGRGGGEEVLL